MSYTPTKNTKFSGDVTTATPTAGDNDTSLATTEYVNTATGSASSNRPAVSLHSPLISGAAQAASGSELTVSTWQTEAYDNDAMHDAVTNPGRITIKTAGTYQFHAAISFTAAATTGFLYVAIKKNGTVVHYGDTQAWNNTAGMGSYVHLDYQDQAVIDDYYEVVVYQGTGATRTFVSTTTGCRFQAAWVGGTGAAWGSAAARVARTSAFSVPHNAFTPVTFNSELVDTDGMANIGTQPTRLTCVTAGTYVVAGTIEMTATSVGIRAARIVHKNSAGTALGYYGLTLTSAPSAGTYGSGGTTEILVMAAGDYVELEAYQNTGAALNTNAANQTYHATMSAARVGYQTNPNKDGQLIGRKTLTANANTGSLAASGRSASFFSANPLVLTGDGVNYIRVELHTYGPYLSAGTTGHFSLEIYDETLAAVISQAQFYATSVGVTSSSQRVTAYIAPFTGTKTLGMRFVNATAGAATITNQASATAPTYMAAFWAGSSNHA